MSLLAIRDLLASASRIAALTGAGISAESGIPTFRGAGGLWRRYKAENLATPDAFARDPKLIWEWYNWRREVIAGLEPNAGHRALAKIEEGSREFTLITQNVDGLHDRAGSRNILKVHGDIWMIRCTACSAERTDLRTPLGSIPPLCSCGGLERPGVVWFGEALPERLWASAQRAAVDADVLLVVGTSAVVYPAAGLVNLAKSTNAKVVEINIEETPISGLVDYSLRAPAAEVLPQLIP